MRIWFPETVQVKVDEEVKPELGVHVWVVATFIYVGTDNLKVELVE